MLRQTLVVRVHSHQLKKGQNPLRPAHLGRNYTRNYIKFGPGGLGISTYTSRKDRRLVVNPLPAMSKEANLANETGLSQTTQSLSPHWRSFALDDGGVLFTHPSHEQVMRWGQHVFRKEAEATGRTSMSEWTDSRIQAILADNTLENYSIKYWRQRHMWNLIKNHGKLHRDWGYRKKFFKDARTSGAK